LDLGLFLQLANFGCLLRLHRR